MHGVHPALDSQRYSNLLLTSLLSPLGLLPDAIHSRLLAWALNCVLMRPLSDGLLDGWQGRTFCIRLTDAPVSFRFTLNACGFLPVPETAACELTLTGSLLDFLALAVRSEDADTLFFQRRLRMEGDTALGLEMKNLLDALEPEQLSLPWGLRPLLAQALGLHEAVFGLRGRAAR